MSGAWSLRVAVAVDDVVGLGQKMRFSAFCRSYMLALDEMAQCRLIFLRAVVHSLLLGAVVCQSTVVKKTSPLVAAVAATLSLLSTATGMTSSQPHGRW